MIRISHFGKTGLIGIFPNLPNKGLIPNFPVPGEGQREKAWAEERAGEHPSTSYIYRVIHLSAGPIKYKSDKLLFTPGLRGNGLGQLSHPHCVTRGKCSAATSARNTLIDR